MRRCTPRCSVYVLWIVVYGLAIADSCLRTVRKQDLGVIESQLIP